MANRNKHMSRSQYSYHNKPDFTDFERKANIKQVKKTAEKAKIGLLGKIKERFRRTTNK
nr:MAG TPA: hypothetical protein [Caudoviricetes sp.]